MVAALRWVIAACFVVPLGVVTYSYEEVAAHVGGQRLGDDNDNDYDCDDVELLDLTRGDDSD